MPRLPLSFVSCLSCGHVWNTEFKYDDVPYSRNPNRMFNRGSGWSSFLAARRDQLLESVPDAGTVVEIGCGEGHFLRELARARPDGRYVGFDPNGAMNDGGVIEFRRELFRPDRHLAELRPSLIIMRHVLEHFENPLAFLQHIDFRATTEGIPVALYAEVPCIDRVPETARLSDFYYEHNSHFSLLSFATLLARASVRVDYVETGYDREMVYGLSQLGGAPERAEHAHVAAEFNLRSARARATIADQLDQLYERSARIAIWGGTGKAAAFINYYGADATRFPLVVDSDLDKTGTFVPGTGQEIQSRDALLATPPDVVIVPMAWRAKDVVEEMESTGIHAGTVLIEHNGCLVDFLSGDHCYMRPSGIMASAHHEGRPSRQDRLARDDVAVRQRRWALAG